MSGPKQPRVYTWNPTLPAGRVLFWLLVASGCVSSILALFDVRRAMTAATAYGAWPDLFRRSYPSSLSTASSPLGLACAILWLVWQHKAQADLVARGVPGLRFTPGWAVGWWFVPFANWVQPFRAVRELSRHAGGSGSGAQSDGPEVKDALLVAWWTCYIGSGLLVIAAVWRFMSVVWPIVERGGSVTTLMTVSASTIRSVSILYLAAHITNAAAAFLAARIVIRISRAEDAARDRIAIPPRPDI